MGRLDRRASRFELRTGEGEVLLLKLLVGETDADAMVVVEEFALEYDGHSSYMCCLSSSCCVWSSRYFCIVKSLLWHADVQSQSASLL